MNNSYKINLEKPDWEFIVEAEDENQGMKKLRKYLDKLMVQDGFTVMALQAKDSIDNAAYRIELYIGFVVV